MSASEFLPSLTQLEEAARIVHAVMPPTPQYAWPLLCDALGLDVWIKHENHTPVGAFKIRGGLVYFDALSRQPQQPSGVISATKGNHGQSIGFAAHRHGIRATIVVPTGNSVEKNAAMRSLGVSLIEHGVDFQAAREYAQSVADHDGLLMVPSFHPLLVRGVATYSLELMSALPDLDVLYVPIGLGSGICGAMAARAALNRQLDIVGVVSTQAPAYSHSFQSHSLREAPVTTRIADGLACRRPEPAALEMMWSGVSRVVEVDDDDVEHAMARLFSTTHQVAEGAGAAPLAAIVKEQAKLRGKKVAFVLSGGNVDRGVYARALSRDPDV